MINGKKLQMVDICKHIGYTNDAHFFSKCECFVLHGVITKLIQALERWYQKANRFQYSTRGPTT